MNKTTLPLIAAGALLLGAGGAAAQTTTTKKPTRLTKAVAKALTATEGIATTKVSCPMTAKLEKGVRVRCTASFTSEDRVGVKAAVVDDAGKVTTTLTGLMLRDLEFRMNNRFVASTGVIADFGCPYRRAVRTGDTFSCYGTEAATDANALPEEQRRHFIYDVTQLGGGKVVFRLRAKKT